jgi:hypothetical protein
MKISLSNLVKGLMAGLNRRYREVLEKRYGLNSSEIATLAAIGQKWGVTRERVRQLEALAIKAVQKNTAREDYRQFIQWIINHLKSAGGVRKQTDFQIGVKTVFGTISQSDALFANQLTFVLEFSDKIFFHGEDKNFYPFWYLTKEDFNKAQRIIQKLTAALQRGHSADEYIQDMISANYISISKKFSVNAYGDFGLADHAEINPKNARDWAYLVLKKNRRPMHFLEIAKAVNNFGPKFANHQTIHNELIKNSNFVLVGKGIYALRERGYEPGTAREVIARLIKKHGPLSAAETIKLVSQERLLKSNTILINLQNRSYFQRRGDGRYESV